MSELVYRTIKDGDVNVGPGAPGLPADVDTPDVIFGIVFELNEQEVRITCADITNMKKKGLDLGLPGRARIGTIADFIKWFDTQFGVKLPEPKDFPPPFDKVFGKIATLVWTVEQAHVFVPGEEEKQNGKPIAYTIEVSALWEKGQGIVLIDKVLTLNGAVFGVTKNEPPKSKPTLVEAPRSLALP